MEENNVAPLCKVCDRGILLRKKTYRLSGPVVAIGYILLVPSILGIAFSLFLLFGVNDYSEKQAPELTAPEPAGMDIQINLPGKAPDEQGIKACEDAVTESVSGSGIGIALADDMPNALCQCQSSQFQATGSIDTASRVCMAPLGHLETESQEAIIAEVNTITSQSQSAILDACKTQIGTAEERSGASLIDATVDTFCQCFSIRSVYEWRNNSPADCPKPQRVLQPTPQQPAPSPWVELFQIFGSVGAIVFGITSFVFGLLGWLLIMKKRVLQCTHCRAIVSAS